MKPQGRTFLATALVLLVFLMLFFGTRGFNQPDEGRYASMGASLLNPAVSWLEPRLSGYAHYDKPPMIYWLTGLSFKVFGVNEFAGRLPSLLGALMAMTGVSWAALRLFDSRTAWWSLVICATLAQFWLLTRFLTPDMFLTGSCTLAIAAWAECRHRQGSWKFWCLSGLFWILAWWTKATPALVPLIGLMVALLITKDRAGWQALRPLRMIMVIIILGLPWYLFMIQQHPELLDFFLFQQMLGHSLGWSEARKAPIWYYCVLSPLFWMPWSLLALGLLLRSNRQAADPYAKKSAWFAHSGWLLVTGLVLFSCNSSKLPTYTLTLVPWAALVLARLFVNYANDRWQKISLAGVTLFYIAVLALGHLLYLPRYESAMGANSSLRPIARILQEADAKTVIFDRYWPGFELYFNGHIIYAVRDSIQQRSDDSPILGNAKITFITPSELANLTLAEEHIWLVHYRKASPAVLENFTSSQPHSAGRKIGDFELIPIKP